MNIALSRLPLIGESWSLVRSERARPYLALTFFIDMALVFVFLVAIQSYLAEQYGGGTALAGYSLAAYGTAKLSGQLLAGRLIDRVGARRGMFVGLALVATGACALILAVLEPVAVLPAAAVYGLGGAAVWPAAYSLAAGEFKTEERARLTASLTVTTGLALACGLGLGFLLPSNFPYPAATALALIPIGGAAFTARAFPSDPSLHLPADGSGEPSGVRVAVRNLLTPKRIAHSAIVLIQAAMVGVMLAIFRSYGRDFIGVSFREELLLLAPAAAAGAGAVVLGGALSDRFGRIGVLGTGFLIAGLAIWGLSGVSSPAAVVPLAIVAALGIGLAVPSISALSIDLSRTAVTGTILAWFLTMEGLGQAAGPALGAWLNKAGGTTTVLWLVGGMSIAVALIALVPPFWHFPERPTPAKQAHRLVAGGMKGALVLGVAFPVAAVYLAYMPSSQVYGHMISHGPRERMEVALTFDDGPNDPWTLRIADTLESNDVKGTFFVNPSTGVVSVTDAHPAGIYIVTVTPFNGGAGSTKTFQLTVNASAVTCVLPPFANAPALPTSHLVRRQQRSMSGWTATATGSRLPLAAKLRPLPKNFVFRHLWLSAARLA